MSKDNLGDRMKGYENIERRFLMRKVPMIIRLDGKAFHSFTRGFKKPFDNILIESMWDTAKYLCENIMGCKLAYVQSDEISLLITDYDSINTEAWFDKNIQKITSVSASMATLAFNKSFSERINTIDIEKYSDFINIYKKREFTALFDSRAFNIPKEEVCNAFIWRQQDATRNAIQMMGRAYFSHKSLQKKSCNEIQEMLFQEKNINFNNIPTYQKRGACVIKEHYDKDGTQRSKWVIDKDIPIFTSDRLYIEKYI